MNSIVRDGSQTNHTPHFVLTPFLIRIHAPHLPPATSFQVIFSLPICIPAFLTFVTMAFLSFPLM